MQQQGVYYLEGEGLDVEDVEARVGRVLLLLPPQDPTPERDQPVEPIGEDEVVPVGSHGGKAMHNPETYIFCIVHRSRPLSNCDNSTLCRLGTFASSSKRAGMNLD